MTGREVYDGGGMGYRWRAHVIESPSPVRRRPGWRVVIQKHHMGWEDYDRSGWFADRDQCERAAHFWLDSKEPRPDETLLGNRQGNET